LAAGASGGSSSSSSSRSGSSSGRGTQAVASTQAQHVEVAAQVFSCLTRCLDGGQRAKLCSAGGDTYEAKGETLLCVADAFASTGTSANLHVGCSMLSGGGIRCDLLLWEAQKWCVGKVMG
jgi:hypothetical protein